MGLHPQLGVLKLANTALQDKPAIELIEAILSKTKIEEIDLSRNQLGFKTGAAIMGSLIE